jgi:hypothetical protein
VSTEEPHDELEYVCFRAQESFISAITHIYIAYICMIAQHVPAHLHSLAPELLLQIREVVIVQNSLM